MATDNPAAYEPDLVQSLSNLGGRLWEVGRQDEALTAIEQSVEIYQRLTADNRTAYEPDLAASLSNLGILLSVVGRWAEGLTATERSVEIYQQLAADNPAAYEPDLATLLSNLGIRLSEGGRWAEALTATERSVEIYQRLATMRRPVLPSLLRVRGLQAVLLDALEREEEAQEVSRWIDENQPHLIRTIDHL
ncbi:tetratricopeptide repeat protein [Embleya scabrispora]|uniref:tetratricopeptide repeat protein n=1 Tax=Embleya scabrispora TaxID=159449 RepID=UPI001374D317|nr:tetratricopeptide repeat protein [Embleya scabrispora]